MKHFITTFYLLLGLTFLVIPNNLVAQDDIKSYKRSGMDFYKKGRFPQAVEALSLYRRYNPKDSKIWYPLALSYYNVNELDEAKILLEGILRANKSAPDELYLILGRICHNNNDFESAGGYYKKFLATVNEKHELYKSIVDDIKRAGFGLRLGPKGGVSNAYSENLGSSVNTTEDEFRPVLSPNYQDKMYFSSNRVGSTGGYQSKSGLSDPENGTIRSDMYGAQVQGGRWTCGEPLSYFLNTSENDVALDFVANGKVLLFYRGKTLFSGDLLVDTFKVQAEERTLISPKWKSSPVYTHLGDRDIRFYNDTIILFSSNRKGGYGGFDVYITKKRNGEWLTPQNLGPEVNSAYDEVTPFLAIDGRTLYFSSNRVDLSVGGFDILKADFDERKVLFKTPENLGLSINSSGDEMNFILAKNGLEGYFDSTKRINSKGKRDIYVAYFKDNLREQSVKNDPLTFYGLIEEKQAQQLLASTKLLLEDGDQSELGKTLKPQIPVKLNFKPLPYDKNDNVATVGNLQRASDIIYYLESNPTASLVITCHSDLTDPERFRAYFGIKRAEAFAEFLIKKGIEGQRIQVISVGSNYPLASNYLNGVESTQGQRLNRRLELHVIPPQEYVLNPQYTDEKVPDFLKKDEFENYRNLQKGVVFRIEVAHQPQRYDNDLWLGLPNPVIVSNINEKYYHYGLGAYLSFNSANQMAIELQNRGFAEATVVAYLNGKRLSKDEVQQNAPYYSALEAMIPKVDIEQD